MVGWNWTVGMPKLFEKSALDVSLTLENENDTSKSIIQYMDPNDFHLGLGFRIAPSGTQKPEIDFRKS